jgi:hypothetical protein
MRDANPRTRQTCSRTAAAGRPPQPPAARHPRQAACRRSPETCRAAPARCASANGGAPSRHARQHAGGRAHVHRQRSRMLSPTARQTRSLRASSRREGGVQCHPEFQTTDTTRQTAQRAHAPPRTQRQRSTPREERVRCGLAPCSKFETASRQMMSWLLRTDSTRTARPARAPWSRAVPAVPRPRRQTRRRRSARSRRRRRRRRSRRSAPRLLPTSRTPPPQALLLSRPRPPRRRMRRCRRTTSASRRRTR